MVSCIRRASQYLLLPFLVYCGLLNSTPKLTTAVAKDDLNRHDFPAAFIFGAGTSAYQVEGAAFEDGRTPSTADFHARTGPIPSNADVTCDEYHRYKDDVRLMVETGLDAYRFSISWSRLLPNGRGSINPKGLEYYNNLIDELVTHGIEAHVTLLHQDVPLVLEDEYGGFTNPRIVEDFRAYAEVCFREFGDRVKHWTTINEANLFGYITYRPLKSQSPISKHKSSYSSSNNNKLNYSTGNNNNIKAAAANSFDPFLIAHHTLLAHASAARLYHQNYKDKQDGKLGFSLYTSYFIPYSNSSEDILACERSYEFHTNWLVHPLMYGENPEMVKKVMGAGLPVFTKTDSELVKGAFDFLALNYYSVILVKYIPPPSTTTTAAALKQRKDFELYIDAECEGVMSTVLRINPLKSMYPICLARDFEDTDPFYGDPYVNTPWGLQGILEYFKHVYNNPPLLIHENGQLTDYHTTTVIDPSRVEYIRGHVESLLSSVRNGSNVLGYFVWSFLDVYEYLYNYEKTFGIYYVDFNDPALPRHPKLSQKWYSRFLNKDKQDNKPTKSQEEEDILQMGSHQPTFV